MTFKQPTINTDEIKAAIAREADARQRRERPPTYFRGQKNIYTCEKCLDHIVTVDIDDGVTPFMIDCRCTEGCDGMMTSSMYRVFEQKMKAGWEWYRPVDTEGMGAWTKDHVEKGGLILRKAGA